MSTATISTSAAVLSRDPGVRLEHEVVQWCESLYQQAIQDKDREREVRDTMKLLDYLEGKQWTEKMRRARSRPVINKTFKHFWENIGLLTDLALDFQVKLFNKIGDYSEFEEMLNKLAVHWALRSDFEATLQDIVIYGLLHTGYAKLQWNSSLNGGMGDIQMIPIAPWNMIVVGAASDLQQAECIIYHRVVTVEHLIRTYGETALRVRPDPQYSDLSGAEIQKPRHISKESWNRMGHVLRQLTGETPETITAQYQMVMLKEFWLRDDSVNETSEPVWVPNPNFSWSYLVQPGEKLYPRGRVIVTAGGCVLADSPNPYWHAKFPFASFRPFRVPWSLSGMSPLKPILQMNNIINRINGGILDMIIHIIEPTLIAPKAAFPPADWEALDPSAYGAKIKYNNNSPKAPEFQSKRELPAFVFSYLQEISKEAESTSTGNAMTQALGKKQVPGGDALEQIKHSRTTPVRVQSRALESFLRDSGSMGVSNMLQFYSVGHRIEILGGEGITSADYRPIYGEAVPKGIKPEEFVRKFMFIIKPGSTLAVEKSEKIQYAFKLRQMGDLSSRGLFRVLDQNFNFERNKNELLEEARLKLLVAAANAAVTGKGQHGRK